MLDSSLLISSGFKDESFGKGTLFMRRDLQNVGNLTIHAKAFISCYDGNKVSAKQAINIYTTAGNRHLCECNARNQKRTFTSTQEALTALGFGADRLRLPA